jgi:hypothetical protein
VVLLDDGGDVEGERPEVVDVTLNGAAFLSNFDIVAAAGAVNKAVAGPIAPEQGRHGGPGPFRTR